MYIIRYEKKAKYVLWRKRKGLYLQPQRKMFFKAEIIKRLLIINRMWKFIKFFDKIAQKVWRER